jgi:hypothetical protein
MKQHRLAAHLTGVPAMFMAAGCCLTGGVGPARAATPPEVEPRILTQTGLNLGLALHLLQNEVGLVDYNDTTPPKCTKLVSAGSIKTLSVVASSPTQRTSKIDAYFDAACKKPYVEATVKVTVVNSTETATFVETATYLQPNGKPVGTLDITDVFSVTSNIETLRGLGKFTPVGQPAADVGFTCSIPITNNAKAADCKAGVAQTFRSLKKSLASVVPFTLTASSNGAAPGVTLVSSASNLRTGPAGSLSITAPTSKTLAISGGGTAYATTTMTGSEGRFVVFPPEPTQWTFTDTKNNAQFAFHVVSNTTRAARASVTTISPAASLATIVVDESGTGKVTYADGRAAPVKGFLAVD